MSVETLSHELPDDYTRTVAAFVRPKWNDHQPSLLICQDTDGRYTLPAGRPKINEPLSNAVLREIEEETGAHPDNLSFISTLDGVAQLRWLFERTRANGQLVSAAIFDCYYHGDPRILRPRDPDREIVDVQSMGLEQISDLVYRDMSGHQLLRAPQHNQHNLALFLDIEGIDVLSRHRPNYIQRFIDFVDDPRYPFITPALDNWNRPTWKFTPQFATHHQTIARI